ncbi:unnamed protein product [Rotaria sp. Silwood2]|nr:unnamed protein product [Rotaria sp. Silwood2]
MANLTSGQEKELRNAFNLFDCNRSGEISKKELKKILKVLHIKANDKELEALHNQMDKDGSGKIDFNEFKAAMGKSYSRRYSTQELEAAFKTFDSDGNGFLTMDELQCVMSKMGRHMTQNEIKVMVKSLDLDKDGKISFNEFIKLFD